MNASINSIRSLRLEEFRRVQESLANLVHDNLINLDEIAQDNVCLDDDDVLIINRLPLKGDCAYLTVNTRILTGYEHQGEPNSTDMKINLDVLSISTLNSIIRVMKKALIIMEIRNLV